jgi:phosphohistidine phosphatase SixA
VAAAAPNVDPIMLVGHQPTWSILASVLTGENVEMKTATVAVIEFDIDSWIDIVTRTGTVRIVLHPRDHSG